MQEIAAALGREQSVKRTSSTDIGRWFTLLQGPKQGLRVMLPCCWLTSFASSASLYYPMLPRTL